MDVLPIITPSYDKAIYNEKDDKSPMSFYSDSESSDDFVIQYCIPGTILMKIITKERLKHDLSALKDAAIKNLKKRFFDNSGHVFKNIGHNIWLSCWNNDHDTGLILLPDELKKLGIDDDKLVVFIPNRSMLFVCPDNDESLTIAAAAVLDILKCSFSIDEMTNNSQLLLGCQHSPAYPLILKGDKWCRYIPDKSMMCFENIKQIYRYTTVSLYQNQTFLQVNEDDITSFKASIQTLTNGMKIENTICFWQGVFKECYIPKSDIIGIMPCDRHDVYEVREYTEGNVFFIEFSNALKLFLKSFEKIEGPLDYYKCTNAPTFDELKKLDRLKMLSTNIENIRDSMNDKPFDFKI